MFIAGILVAKLVLGVCPRKHLWILCLSVWSIITHEIPKSLQKGKARSGSGHLKQAREVDNSFLPSYSLFSWPRTIFNCNFRQRESEFSQCGWGPSNINEGKQRATPLHLYPPHGCWAWVASLSVRHTGKQSTTMVAKTSEENRGDFCVHATKSP